MSNLFAVAGLAALVVAAFLASLIVGVAVLGVALLLLAVATADGKGVSWRS